MQIPRPSLNPTVTAAALAAAGMDRAYQLEHRACGHVAVTMATRAGAETFKAAAEQRGQHVWRIRSRDVFQAKKQSSCATCQPLLAALSKADRA